MNAAEARRKSCEYIAKLREDHDREYEKAKAKEARQAQALWKLRGATLVLWVEGMIEKAASKGYRGTYAPTKLNPNGDEIIRLEEADLPIHDMLMDYFRGEGFDVEEYQGGGMKITW